MLLIVAEEPIRNTRGRGKDWLPGHPRLFVESKTMQTIALTANFTAEPIEEPLKFWMTQLDTPCAVQFAPYNQVFQQLLDPASLVSTNKNGLNVVLIRLEDWWTGGPARSTGMDRSKERNHTSRVTPWSWSKR